MPTYLPVRLSLSEEVAALHTLTPQTSIIYRSTKEKRMMENQLSSQTYRFSTPIRTYRKEELAQMYSPGSSPEAAQRKLRRWIAGCKDLTEALRSLHLSPSKLTFRPQEVFCMFQYLGEP
jgi:hypothetical protein